MKNLPNLGKPTRQGYRQSKGYVIQQGRMVQKTFWLGHDPAVAVQKIAALEEIANAVTPTDGKLVWNEDALARVTAAFEAIDGRATTIKIERALPTVVAPPSVAEARPVVASEPPPLPTTVDSGLSTRTGRSNRLDCQIPRLPLGLGAWFCVRDR